MKMHVWNGFITKKNAYDIGKIMARNTSIVMSVHLCFLETGSHCVAHTSLELAVQGQFIF
jgi:hypothetical protein